MENDSRNGEEMEEYCIDYEIVCAIAIKKNSIYFRSDQVEIAEKILLTMEAEVMFNTVNLAQFHIVIKVNLFRIMKLMRMVVYS